MKMDKLITIATMSKEFRKKLLTNPQLAIEEGYQGKKIKLTAQDSAILLRHDANTLEELAEYILNQEPNPTAKKKTKIIITPNDYPVITVPISKELNTYSFHVQSTSSQSLIDEPARETDLVLFCPISQFSLVVCTKLMALYPKKLVVLTDLKNQKIPDYLLEQVSFISLNENIPQIIRSILDACSDVSYSPKATRQLISQYINKKDRIDALTPREEQIAYLLGSTNQKIADRLCISLSTVRTHIQKINEKVGFDVRKILCNIQVKD